MQKMFMFIVALASTSAFAAPKIDLSQRLTQAFNTPANEQTEHQHGITMVYGGADISLRPTLIMRTTTA